MIRDIKVPYRFSNDMLKEYVDYINAGIAAGREPMVFADVGSRSELKEILSQQLAPHVFERVAFRAYPSDPRAALNLGRGHSNRSFLIMDERGRYTDQIVQSLSWSQSAGNIDGLIVHH